MPEERDIHTILVVEDEVLVRMTIADYLRECGFQVAEAGSADEALAILNSEMPVDLVFSDVQMPGTMNGFGLAQWIRQHRPDLKVILTSGANDAAAEAGDLCDDGPLLAKPYDHIQLVERIKRLLGTRERFRNRGVA